MFCCVTLRRTVRELRACEKLFSLNLTPLAACVCGVWRRAAAKCVFPLFSALKNFVYDMLYIKIPHFLSSTQWYRFQPSQAVKKCVQKLCCWVCMKSLGKMVVIAQGIFDLRVLYQEKIRFEKCAQKVGILKFFSLLIIKNFNTHPKKLRVYIKYLKMTNKKCLHRGGTKW